MTSTPKIVWRNALMLCAAAVAAVLVSSCRAPASETGRYQWGIVSQGEGRQDQIYVIDTVTGEVAEWSGSSWSSSYRAPLSTPDWNDIRKQRERDKKRAEREKKQQEEALVKCEAFAKSFPQLPLEKQVAWAKDISICKFRGKNPFHSMPPLSVRYPGLIRLTLEHVETLKGERGSLDKSSLPYKATDDGIVVLFTGTVEGRDLLFGLSRKPIDNKAVFPAPETIIDDVKAEIKRQEEKQKEAHAEHH